MKETLTGLSIFCALILGLVPWPASAGGAAPPKISTPFTGQSFALEENQVYLRWAEYSPLNAGSGYKIVIEQKKQDAFTPYLELFSVDPHITTPPLPAGWYRFRVATQHQDSERVIDPSGVYYGGWSQYVEFGIGAESPTYPNHLRGPTITSPLNNQELHNYPRRVSVSWTGSPAALFYEVDVQCDLCGSTTWTSNQDFFVASTHAITGSLAGDNHFRVRVRAWFTSTQSSAWSEFMYFNYKTKGGKPEKISRLPNNILNGTAVCETYSADDIQVSKIGNFPSLVNVRTGNYIMDAQTVLEAFTKKDIMIQQKLFSNCYARAPKDGSLMHYFLTDTKTAPVVRSIPDAEICQAFTPSKIRPVESTKPAWKGYYFLTGGEVQLEGAGSRAAALWYGNIIKRYGFNRKCSLGGGVLDFYLRVK